MFTPFAYYVSQVNPVTSDLVMRFDAANYPGSGVTWPDTSTNGWDATITTATYTGTGDTSYFDFDGTNDYITVPATNWTGGYPFTGMNASEVDGPNWTMETVCWLTSGAGDNAIASIYDSEASNNRVFAAELSGDSPYWVLRMYDQDSGSSGRVFYLENPTTVITHSTWLHVVMAHEQDVGLKVYANDTLIEADANGFASGKYWKTPATNRDLYIGAEGTTGGAVGKKLDGRIAVMNFYNKALSSAEVSQNYTYYSSRY